MRITQRKGDIAVSQAIATFTKMGYDVFIPITESSPYDLIVDKGGLKRVQVKYTSTGAVDLRRIHSNSNGYVVKTYSKYDYDWLYILYSTGEEFLVKKFINQRSYKPRRGNQIGD